MDSDALKQPRRAEQRFRAEVLSVFATSPSASSSPLGFAHVQTPTFARGNVFTNEPSAQQVHEQDKYKVYLKEQVNARAVPGAFSA